MPAEVGAEVGSDSENSGCMGLFARFFVFPVEGSVPASAVAAWMSRRLACISMCLAVARARRIRRAVRSRTLLSRTSRAIALNRAECTPCFQALRL